MKIAIFGIGLIGGSVAKDLRETGFAAEILGVEKNENHARTALELGLVDKIVDRETAIAEADLIILSIPVGALIDQLNYVLANIKPASVVTDMGSTKGAIIDGVKNSPNRSRYVASHPMAGTEYSGPTAAVSRLFEGKICIICDREESDDDAVETVERMYAALGMRVKYMESHRHDMHAAYVSHISHISAFVLAATVLEKEKDEEAILEMAGGGFASAARLAKSSPETWSPIFEQNRDYLLEAIDTYIEKMYRFRNLINKNKYAEIEKFMTEANEIRKILK
jgi:prephenate dehydrogenase